MADVAQAAGIRRQLILTQQFSGGEQLPLQHLATCLVQAADLRQTVQVIDRQKRFRGNIRIVQQVGAVAGDLAP